MSSRLARSAGLISIATLASRILGVARETVLASYFGASAPMDAFNVAFRIPNLLRDLFAEGAMTAAFVPAFTRTIQERGREHAWRLGNLVINALLVITGAIVVLGIMFAAPITGDDCAEVRRRPRQAGADDAADPGDAAVPHHRRRRGRDDGDAELAAPVLHPGAVAGDVQRGDDPLRGRAGAGHAARSDWPPIMAIAIGTLLGGLGQMVIQWPVLRREGFRYRPILDFKDPELRQILRLMGPGTLGVAAVKINVLVNTYLAAAQPGAVSWLGYAFRLMYLPIGLFGVSIATAALPDISRHAAAGDVAAIRRGVSSAAPADADAERAGDDRPDRAGRADRGAPVSARPLHRRRHRAPRRRR